MNQSMWTDLLAALEVPRGDNGIQLPVGSCGLIHVRRRKTEIQVSNRRYLQHQLCPDPSCPTTSTELFWKSRANSEPLLQRMRSRRLRNDQRTRLHSFCSCLAAAFLVDTQQLLAMQHSSPVSPPPSDEALLDALNALEYCCRCYRSHVTHPVAPRQALPPPLQACQQTHCCTPGLPTDGPPPEEAGSPCSSPCERDLGCGAADPGCWGELVYALLAAGDVHTLTQLDRQRRVSIKQELRRTFGGQAVGVGFNFLMLHHLLPMYITSQAIIAAGLSSSPEKWGCMCPGSSFRRWLMDDCDYRTCVPSFRPALQEGVYMCDMALTSTMLENCFHMLAAFFMLKECDQKGVKEHIQQGLQASFGFKFQEF